jgi:hypothetical protein
MAVKIGTERTARDYSKYLYYVGADGHVYQNPRKGTKGVKKRISTVAVKREPGHMYFPGKDGYVYKARMARR